MNFYTRIASRNPVLDSPAMTIPGLEKSRLSDNPDGRPSRVGSNPTQQDISLPAPISDKLPPATLADRASVGCSSPLHSHMDTNLIPSKRADRWKLKFNSLNIPNQIGLVDWAREAGCAQNHNLIANCLSFMDSEAQVSSVILTPNILY